uniref:PIR Superfamily Protein n=1 Tax=Parastrongyloides trichosuri TaxID=131310 RepID=A0A0N4ZQX7_PARTI
MSYLQKEESFKYVNYSLDPNNETEEPLNILELKIDPSFENVKINDEAAVTPNSMKPNIIYPKRKYTISRKDSLKTMEIPKFSKKEKSGKHRKKGPSSVTTVLAMAGLFICGIMLMISGIIILTQQREYEFMITGIVFVSTGFVMLLTCLILQWKNVKKYIYELNQDLYFLRLGESQLWNFVFNHDDSSKYEKPYHR